MSGRPMFRDHADYKAAFAADKTKIIGSARLGEVVVDGGKLAELLPEIYSPFYETYDLPYCSATFPRCHVKVGEHYFDIDYRLYRELAFINEDDEIIFDLHHWKDMAELQWSGGGATQLLKQWEEFSEHWEEFCEQWNEYLKQSCESAYGIDCRDGRRWRNDLSILWLENQDA